MSRAYGDDERASAAGARRSRSTVSNSVRRLARARPSSCPQAIDLTSDGLPTVTWVYDQRRRTSSTWSAPIEELFGFPAGIRGFSGRSQRHARRSDEPEVTEAAPARLRRPRPDIGAALLAPILAPIRAGVPPADFDLQLTVDLPRRDQHQVVVIRTSPARRTRTTRRSVHRLRRLPRRRHRRHRPSRSSSGAERPGRPLPAAHRGLPRRGRRPPGRPPRLRQPGRPSSSTPGRAGRVLGDYYGEPITDFVHPDDIDDTSNGSPS